MNAPSSMEFGLPHQTISPFGLACACMRMQGIVASGRTATRVRCPPPLASKYPGTLMGAGTYNAPDP
jgi:hypothetical protein